VEAWALTRIITSAKVAFAMTSHDGWADDTQRPAYARRLPGFSRVLQRRCVGDGKKCHARSGDRTPCSLILFQARGPGSKYHGEDSAPVAQSGHEGVGVVVLPPACGITIRLGAFDRRSIALASADRKAGLVISMGLAFYV